MHKGNNKSLKVFFLWVLLSFVFVMLDQVSKNIALRNLEYLNPVKIFSGLDFTLVFNEGAAFSFLSEAGGWQRWFFCIFAFFAITFLLIYLFKIVKQNSNELLKPFALSLVIGGAFGNFLDRLISGYVVDFISVYYKNWYWPAFNIADICISFGVILLIIELFINESKKN